VRYGVLADLHGRLKAWRRVRGDAERLGVDALVCLGDYLEAKVPRRRHDPTRRWSLPQVVDPDPPLWRELAGIDLVLGNQEERIRALLAPEQVPDLLAPLLAAPRQRAVGDALGVHGDRFGWTPTLVPAAEPADTGRGAERVLYPRAEDLPRVPLLFAGHSHQTLLLDITWPGCVRGESARAAPVAVRRLPVEVGRPYRLRPDAGRTLFVNVGPAREKPSHWLLYDVDRAEITFRECPGARDGTHGGSARAEPAL
jgi:hypothetical protein